MFLDAMCISYKSSVLFVLKKDTPINVHSSSWNDGEWVNFFKDSSLFKLNAFTTILYVESEEL